MNKETKIIMTVSQLIDLRYRDYSMYVLLQRAIPSMIDGFKPVQRKALYVALKIASKEKCKVATLGASLPMMCNYHHGEGSASGAVVNMAQRFKNNIPLFIEHGSFGSRLIPTAAAPRYIFVKNNPEALKYFSDWEILPENQDPENPEPAFYLPLIPWVLLNGVKGVAVGFATDILPRSIDDLKEACSLVAQGKSISHLELKPSFPQFRGEVVKTEKNDKWMQIAPIIRKNPTKVIVEDIPTEISRENYIIHLDKLCDKGKIVKYVDLCGRDKKVKGSISKFKFEVTLPRSSKDMSDMEVKKLLKLTKTFSENISVVDQDGNLKLYSKPHDLIKDFVAYRVSMYPKRYARLIKNAKARMSYLDAKAKFIKMVNDGDIVLKGKNKKELRAELTKIFASDVIDKLLALHIYSLCLDEIESLNDSIISLETDIDRWKNSIPTKDYVDEVLSL